MDDDIAELQDVAQETPADNVFVPPSIRKRELFAGQSYSHYSAVPRTITADMDTECVLGVDEAGRGPVLGPMVYGLFYLPITSEKSLLTEVHHFDDSKVLTPEVRSNLMAHLCTSSTDLNTQCGWATRVMSARDISANMMRASSSYNLNAQAMDATTDLIQGVLDQGVNIREIYVDTIGNPASYQARLQRVFPAIRITVAKKADSLYPCVSAASVCAKVTRDAALEECFAQIHPSASQSDTETAAEGWGSGYPSDARTSTWLKRNMNPIFGWGNEARFSWGTAKEMLEAKGAPLKVEWPVEDDDSGMKISQFFAAEDEEEGDELTNWYGRRMTEEVF